MKMGLCRWCNGKKKKKIYLPMQVIQDHWIRQIPWNRKWQPAPGFLPRKFYVPRSLVGYS